MKRSSKAGLGLLRGTGKTLSFLSGVHSNVDSNPDLNNYKLQKVEDNPSVAYKDGITDNTLDQLREMAQKKATEKKRKLKEEQELKNKSIEIS